MAKILENLIDRLHDEQLSPQGFIQTVVKTNLANKGELVKYVRTLVKQREVKSKYLTRLERAAKREDRKTTRRRRRIDLSKSQEGVVTDAKTYSCEALEISEFGLAINPTLETVVSHLSGIKPRWKKIVKRVIDTYGTKFFDYNFGFQKGALCEAHLQLGLEKIASRQNKVVLNPIKARQTVEYDFTSSDLNLAISKHGQGKAELDTLSVIDGLPAIFEFKSGQYFSGARAAMQVEEITKKLTPIRDHFRQYACGYIVVLPKDQVSIHSPTQQEFTLQNGLLVPLYASRAKFTNDCEQIIKQAKRKY